MSIKKLIRRSPFILNMLAGICYYTTWLLIKAGQFFMRLTDWYIKKTSKIFALNKRFSRRYIILLGKYLMPHRLNTVKINKMHQHNIRLNASLASSLFLRHTYSSGLVLPEWKIDNKITGLNFAKALGLKTPQLFLANVSFNNIIPIPNTILKPIDEASARGTFIVFNKKKILELKTGNEFLSWEELGKHIKGLLENKIVGSDNWMVEEYICKEDGTVANDIKFYVFYGQLGWISEIQRQPKKLHNTIDKSGKPLDYKIYKKNVLFRGAGASGDEIAMVEKTSLEIPAPFIRIDFLRGKNGLVFGEFTPRPGIIGAVNKIIDLNYGKMFHDADARLYTDLISGKKFDLFNYTTR